MKKAAEGFVKYRMAEAMTARRYHDGMSQGPSTRTRFERFSAIMSLFIRFLVFIIGWKTLVFGVRIFVVRLFVSRLSYSRPFDIRLLIIRLVDIRLLIVGDFVD